MDYVKYFNDVVDDDLICIKSAYCDSTYFRYLTVEQGKQLALMSITMKNF